MTEREDTSGMITVLQAGGGKVATKKPISVIGEQLRTTSTIPTREGLVSAPAGDWVLQDSAGNRWPVSTEHLLTYYTCSDPNPAHSQSRWIAKPQTVRVLQLTCTMLVPVGRDGELIQGKPNDWLIYYESNSFGIVAADLFNDLYELR